MVQQFNQNLQPFIAGQLFVKLAIGFFSLGETAKFPYRFVHDLKTINLAAAFSE
jgi:hypothetical protein